MVEKVIKIVADTNQATKEIKDLFNTMVKQEKEAQSQSEKTAEAVEDIGKASKKTQKDVNAISKGFKGLGLAMKAAGIGLVISAMESLKEIFSQNQRVVDAVSTGFETFSIVVNQLVTGIINVYDAVAASSENFNGLQKVMSGLLTIALTPIKLAFFNIKLALETAQLAWEQSFFGGKDADKILQLNKDITETQKSIMGVGVDALNAGKDIINNFSDAVGEIGNIGSLAADELSKISIKSAFEQAKMNVELKNTAELAAAQQSRLVEQYDRQAEKLRQIRDTDLNTIADRKKANEELALVLENQEKAMIAAANSQVAAAQANLKTNDTIENQVALIDALANKEGVLAQVEGLRSEQLANRNALLREEYDLNIAISDGENERRLAQLQFEEEMAETQAGKLDKERERLELENQMLLEDIEAKRLIYAEGTQARIDAENDYALRSQEITNAIAVNTKNKEEEKDKVKTKSAEFAMELQRIVEGNAVKLADQTLSNIASLAKEGSDLAKGVAVAQATMDTFKGAVSAYAAGSSVGGPAGLVLGPVSAALAVAAGLGNIKKILSTKPIEKGAPSGAASGGGAAVPQAPAFNLVEGSGTNQIAESIGGQNKPLQAFVVSSEVTTAQGLDRNIVDNSGF
jgi:hypothetical protein